MPDNILIEGADCDREGVKAGGLKYIDRQTDRQRYIPITIDLCSLSIITPLVT